MDDEYQHPHSEHQEPPITASAPAESVVTPDAATVIEQVRELLFGDHRRTTEGSLKGLEDRLAALTATVEARFADLERRIGESRSEADSARESNVAAIGSALMELGERIKTLIPKPQG